jgi:hypothetical protein
LKRTYAAALICIEISEVGEIQFSDKVLLVIANQNTGWLHLGVSFIAYKLVMYSLNTCEIRYLKTMIIFLAD